MPRHCGLPNLYKLLGELRLSYDPQAKDPFAVLLSMPTDRERIQLLFSNVSRALGKIVQKPTPENVHAFRTSSRRLETCLQALAPDRNRKLLKQLRRWRRRAGTLRDMDVQLNALRSFKVLENPARKSQLMRVLLDTRARRERKLLKAFDEKRRQRFHRCLRKASAGLRALDKTIADPLAPARRMFEQLAREHPAMSEATLHEYRLKCKRIRYIAELSERPEAEKFIAGLVRIQDVTGAWRDWQMLKDSAEGQMQDVPPSGLLAALRNVGQVRFQEAARVCTEVRDSLLGVTTSDAAVAPSKPAKSIRFKLAAAATA